LLLLQLFIFSTLTGLTAQDSIAAVRGEDRGTEGQRVSLRCNYETTSNLPNLHWYKQVSDVEAPQFLLWKGAKNQSKEAYVPNDRYGSVTTDTSTELQIETATLADSGLYYCALETQWCNM
uniref:Ig-like domain-containing protein n=1 Tax=Xiphophorus maculatus TaxID=8083 RepID=A0A3B5QF30_XIPMA